MDLPIPPFDRYRVRLRLTAPARFQFLHGGVLRGLLSGALGRHDLPPTVIPFAPEAGRLSFAAGDPYHLGVTFVGDERRLGGRLFAGLVKLGARRPTTQPPPTLGGNFEVETIEALPPVDLDAEIDQLADGSPFTTELLSPLRLKRPDHLLEFGGGYVNGACFPGGHFLERLWCRLFLLAHGRYPELDERRAASATAAAVEAVPGDMPWVDHEVTGSRFKNRTYRIGGVLGRVTWPEVPDAWLPILAAGRHLQAGAGPAYGFGRYRLLPEPAPEPFTPARPLWPGNQSAEPQLPPDLHSILETLVEASTLTLRLGLSIPSMQRAEREARRDGYRWRRRADLARLLDLVDLQLVHDRLRALFPLQLPVEDQRHMTPRAISALPAAARSTLALLVLPEIAGALPRHIRLLRMADGYFLLSCDTLRLSALAGGKVYLAAQPAAESWHARSLA